ERGLVGPLLGAQKSDQHVEAERHQLQADEQRHQVGAGSQEIHSALSEQNQAVVFAVVLARDLEILVGDQRYDYRRYQKDPVKEDARAIDGHGPVEPGIERAIDRKVHLLLDQSIAGEGLRDQHEVEQKLALPGIGEEQKVE